MRILRHDQPGDGHGIRAQILFSDGQEADIPVSALLGMGRDLYILWTVLPSAHWRAPPTKLATNDITKKSFNFCRKLIARRKQHSECTVSASAEYPASAK